MPAIGKFGRILAWGGGFNDEVEYVPWDDVRENSRQLEEFRNDDFNSMDEEISQLMPHATSMQPRYVSLVRRVAEERAALYRKPPRREFDGLRNQAQRDALEAAYRDLKVDLVLRVASRKAVPQQSVLIVPIPVGRRVILHSFCPYEAEVHFRQMPLDDDIRYADKVSLRVPLREDDEKIVYGKLHMTQTEAWYEAPGGGKTAVWGEGEDMRHPFPHIPVVGVRHSASIKGRWMPRVDHALLSNQVALNITLTDIDRVNRFQAHGKEVLMGPGASVAARKKQVASAEHMRVFDAGPTGDRLEYKLLNSQPAVLNYLKTALDGLRLMAAYKYVSPEGITGSRAETGDAKEVEREDLIHGREDMEVIWRQAEQDLLDLIVQLSRVGPRLVGVSPGVTVKVDFVYPKPRRNNLQTMQATALEHELGLDSAVEKIMRSEGVDEAAAQKLYDQRLERQKDWKEAVAPPQSGAGATPNQTTPGLDKLDNNVKRVVS